MICSDYQLLIPYRRTGDLLAEDLALLDRHLATCPTCAAMAAPNRADESIRAAIRTLDVPANLKSAVSTAVAAEQSANRWRSVAKILAASAFIGLIFAGSYGYHRWTRPRLDGEGLAIRNGFEADRSQVQNLLYDWLLNERLPTELPFDFDMPSYAAHGFEHFGRTYVPFIKFQSNAASFAKLYFVRTGDVDTSTVIDGTQSSFCTVRVVPGPRGMTFVVVHTGNDPAPFIREAKPNHQ
jgi:hypothetical protein